MATKIEQRIVKVSVRQPPEEEELLETVEDPTVPARYVYEEPMDRPRVLNAKVYKISPPNQHESLYVTITNHEVNGEVRPFELFVMSKNMYSFQWISLLTRMISALLRQPHTEFPMFVIEEMLSTFDPNGGYFTKIDGRSKMVPSVVAEIGHILKSHCRELGLVEGSPAVGEEVGAEPSYPVEETPMEEEDTEDTRNKQMCGECGEMEVVIMDGCATCLACGDSKCG